ncbi:uncharacterized protein LOC116027865 [Ipomoea triloba]|uniref:uncharacterized protein LOC116027865 n=1 Tax=Ipomoea triloba TaxID=35885 RepID=UPI00125CF132|nr:uncharacterized protein LOC116027865 [Ipomoea triloba]
MTSMYVLASQISPMRTTCTLKFRCIRTYEGWELYGSLLPCECVINLQEQECHEGVRVIRTGFVMEKKGLSEIMGKEVIFHEDAEEFGNFWVADRISGLGVRLTVKLRSWFDGILR